MDETYLEDLKNRAGVLQAEIGTLEAFKSRLIRETNSLRSLKKDGARNVEGFIKDQLDYMVGKVKESQKWADEEIARNKDKIVALNKKAKQVEESWKSLEEEKKALDLFDKDVSSRNEKLINQKEKVDNMLVVARRMMVKAKDENYQAEGEKSLSGKLLTEATLILDRLSDFESEFREKISTKKRLLDKQYDILLVKEKLLKAKELELNDQEQKVADQWDQIIKAKEYLDDKR